LDKAFIQIDRSIEGVVSRVLIVEDVAIHAEIVRNLLVAQYGNIEIIEARNVEAAGELLTKGQIDFIVLDLDLGKGPEEGVFFLEKLKSDKRFCTIPVIVFTGMVLENGLEERIRALSTRIVNKDGTSYDLILEESHQFLHAVSQEPAQDHAIPLAMFNILKGKTVWLIDDDMRNIYTLSGALESQGLKLITAITEAEVMARIQDISHADIILVNTEMQCTDTFSIIRQIRNAEKFSAASIIALTARSRAADRERSLQCGASDYISNPIDTNQLLSLMRVWLFKD
jgi:CheY-like chemotaxis protein